jgi:hypothetical protein
MLRETPLYLRLNPADDVVIACRELEAGTNLLQGKRRCRRAHPRRTQGRGRGRLP